MSMLYARRRYHGHRLDAETRHRYVEGVVVDLG